MKDLYIITVSPIIRFNGKFISFNKKINTLSNNIIHDNQIKFNAQPNSEEEKRVFNEVTEFIYKYLTLVFKVKLDKVLIKLKTFISYDIFPSVRWSEEDIPKLNNYNNGLNIVLCLVDIISSGELPESCYNIDEKEKHIIETYKVYYENFFDGVISCSVALY